MNIIKSYLTKLVVCMLLIHFSTQAMSQKENNTTSFDEVFLHTDKSIYSPGDDLWFKAYILDDEFHTPSNLSKILYVNLIDFNGNEILNEKFPIQKGLAYGDIQIPDSLKKGIYKIIAYTENLINLSHSFWFCSEINIDPSSIDLWDINFYPELQKLSENNLYGEIICMSSAGFPISDAKITYKIESADNTILSKTVKTDTLGKVIINWSIDDDNQNKSLVLNIEANYLNKNKNLSVSIPKSKGINLKFFPESGNLIQGIQNQVAFKITDNFGNPLSISGTLQNQNGKVLKSIQTIHQGMGVFSITPEANESYFVQLNKPELADSLYALPKALISGYTLSLIESEKNILTLLINMTDDLKGKNVKLSVSNGLKYENLFESVLGNEKRFSFITSSLPVGIATITLFSENIPVAERLVFLNKYKKLNFTIESEKEIFEPREKVKLNIKTYDFEGKPSAANLSLAVTEKIKTNGLQDIASYLLLSSKIKDVEEDLSYYLKESQDADSALNLLLMTHGWRKIEKVEEYTKMVINVNNLPGIRGTVLTKKGKPTGNAQVQILDTKTWQVISTETNNNGRFFIPMENYIPFAKSQNLSISASIPNKSKDLIISIDPDIDVAILSNFKKNPNILLAYNLPEKVKTKEKDTNFEYTDFDKTSEFIDEVIITEKRYDPVYDEARKNPYNVYKKNAEELHTETMTMTPPITPVALFGDKVEDQSILTLVQAVAPPFEIINGQIVFRGRNSITGEYVTGALFVVNGVPMGNNISNMSWVNPLNVKEVKVITSPGASLRYGSSSKGLIEIIYLEGNENALKQVNIEKDENISIVKGFKLTKEFYSPDYSVKISDEENKLNSRSTLYWNPNINIDESGNKTITFYNGDKRTFFRIFINGIDGNGLMGNQEKTIRVN